MNKAMLAALALFVAGALLAIGQLWFRFLAADTFVKVEVTLATLLGTLLVVLFVAREHKDTRRMRGRSELD
jgi:hypothetical protein